MGLDFLEIAYEIENEFGIELSEDSLQGLIRDRDIYVGDLYDYVLAKLGLHDQTRNSVALNASLWREMQVVLGELTGRPTAEITLQTSMTELFPQQTRREDWSELQAASPFRIRELDYAPLVRRVAFLLTAGVAYIELRHLWQFPAVQWLWPMLGLVGLWIIAETHVKILTILRPLRNHLPAGMHTVKELCRDVLASDYEQVCRFTEVEIDDRCLAVWQRLVEILSTQLHLEPREINFRSRLIHDLGMG